MIKINENFRINTPQGEVFKALVNYKNYPKYMMGIQKTRAGKKLDKFRREVVYHVAIMGKAVSYTLMMNEKPNTTLSWKLEDSELMRHNTGKWTLKSAGKSATQVNYQLNLDLDIPIPSLILNKGAKVQVSKMLEAFKEFCETGETL